MNYLIIKLYKKFLKKKVPKKLFQIQKQKLKIIQIN